MNTIKMNLSDLRHPEKNVRKHPPKQIAEMKRSIEMFGQFRPVVVDETNTILAGNGLVLAMREMGMDEVDVIKYDNLTNNQKKKLMIADNQTASLGVDDYAAIEEVLRSLEGDFDVPGFDEDAIKLLVEETVSVAQEIGNYGFYPQAEIERLQKEEAKREEFGFKPVEQSTPTPFAPLPQAEPMPSPMAQTAPSQEEPTQSVGRYVICPHCGEKIYI